MKIIKTTYELSETTEIEISQSEGGNILITQGADIVWVASGDISDFANALAHFLGGLNENK